MRKTSKYDQHFNLKMEQRTDMLTKGYGAGSAGCRAGVYWGTLPSAPTNFPNTEHLLYPFATYEWDEWRAKFEEYRITGVKIKVQPGVSLGANNFKVMQNIGMGTSPAEITNADNVATNILY